jgi:hypothetical protein
VLKPGVPAAIEPIGDGLQRLRIDRLPMPQAGLSQLRELLLKLRLLQALTELFVVNAGRPSDSRWGRPPG